MTKLEDKECIKLRDDLMHMRGELTGLGWVIDEHIDGHADWVQNIREQFDSILKRLFEGYQGLEDD